MRRLIVIIILCFWMAPAGAARVCSVHDGDTLTLCNNTRIRLWGIDAPELAQPFGLASRDYLSQLVARKSLAMYCRDVSHGRLVCSVYDGKVNINRQMVLAGMAFDSPQFSKGRFKMSESSAQTLGVGVWSMANGGIRPWLWRKKHFLRHPAKMK